MAVAKVKVLDLTNKYLDKCYKEKTGSVGGINS